CRVFLVIIVACCRNACHSRYLPLEPLHEHLRNFETTLSALATFRHVSIRKQVNQGKNNDPDDINEVPIESGDFQGHRVLGAQPASQAHEQQSQQPQHTNTHVNTVETGECEEGATEDVALQGEAR